MHQHQHKCTYIGYILGSTKFPHRSLQQAVECNPPTACSGKDTLTKALDHMLLLASFLASNQNKNHHGQLPGQLGRQQMSNLQKEKDFSAGIYKLYRTTEKKCVLLPSPFTGNKQVHAPFGLAG